MSRSARREQQQQTPQMPSGGGQPPKKPRRRRKWWRWVLGLVVLLGIIGGIGVGYSAGYKCQTVFNTFGALAIAASLFGLPMALLLRTGINVTASLYTVVCNVVYDKLHGKRAEIAENLVKP